MVAASSRSAGTTGSSSPRMTRSPRVTTRSRTSVSSGSAAVSAAGVEVPVRGLGLDQAFLTHDARAKVLAAAGLTDQDVARRITEWVSHQGPATGEAEDHPADRLAR